MLPLLLAGASTGISLIGEGIAKRNARLDRKKQKEELRMLEEQNKYNADATRFLSVNRDFGTPATFEEGGFTELLKDNAGAIGSTIGSLGSLLIGNSSNGESILPDGTGNKPSFFFLKGGQLQPLSSTGAIAEGQSHQEGGIQIGNAEIEGDEALRKAPGNSSGTQIFSDQLGIGDTSFADIAAELMEKIGKIEKSISGSAEDIDALREDSVNADHYERNANEREADYESGKINAGLGAIAELNIGLDQVFEMQQQMNNNNDGKQKFRSGGIWGPSRWNPKRSDISMSTKDGIDSPYVQEPIKQKTPEYPSDRWELQISDDVGEMSYSKDDEPPTKVGNFLRDNKDSLGMSLLYAMDNVGNLFNKPTKPIAPAHTQFTPMNTNVNMTPVLNEIDKNRVSEISNVNKTMSSPQAAMAFSTLINSDASDKTLKALMTGIDKESDLKRINSQGLNQTSAFNTSVDNQHLVNLHDYSEAVRGDNSKNLSNWAADVNQIVHNEARQKESYEQLSLIANSPEGQVLVNTLNSVPDYNDFVKRVKSGRFSNESLSAAWLKGNDVTKQNIERYSKENSLAIDFAKVQKEYDEQLEKEKK